MQVKKVVLLVYNSLADAVFTETQLIAKYQPKWNKQGLDETPSIHHIDCVARVELKVLTKHLNEFVQKQLTNS